MLVVALEISIGDNWISRAYSELGRFVGLVESEGNRQLDGIFCSPSLNFCFSPLVVDTYRARSAIEDFFPLGEFETVMRLRLGFASLA